MGVALFTATRFWESNRVSLSKSYGFSGILIVESYCTILFLSLGDTLKSKSKSSSSEGFWAGLLEAFPSNFATLMFSYYTGVDLELSMRDKSCSWVSAYLGDFLAAIEFGCPEITEFKLFVLVPHLLLWLTIDCWSIENIEAVSDFFSLVFDLSLLVVTLIARS